MSSRHHIDHAYRSILQQIIRDGTPKPDRTGVGTISIPAAMFQYDLAWGPPVLHGKKIATRSMITELAGFLQGRTDKRWYQERKCKIWNEWCNPQKVPYSNNDPAIQARMAAETDLGPIYGAQWRNFMGTAALYQREKQDGGQAVAFSDGYETIQGVDQLNDLLKTLEKDPNSRRMIVSAWNPIEQPMMALPPCHFSFQVIVTGGKLNLNWNQRSVDSFIGLPFNIASYGVLAYLLAKQFDLGLGMLTGFLGDTHIYNNHTDQVDEYLSRMTKDNNSFWDLSDGFESVLNFEPDMLHLRGYEPWPAIEAPINI